MLRCLLVTLIALVAAVALADAGRIHDTPARVAVPTFIAIGGGLEDDNEAVFRHLLIRKDTNKIVIVPFASADAKAAATRTAERFRAHRPDARIVTLPDPLDGPDAASLAADWIAHADLVYFTGGDQSRITPRFLGENGPNAVLQALQQGQLKWATLVGGTSAGCAVLSDPMFTGGGSESALANLPATDGEPDADTANATPPKSGVRLGKGLGLVPDVIMDSHFLERGRFGRMVAALESASRRFGVGVNENRAVAISGDVFTAIGNHAALVVDVKALAREGRSRRNIRISLLCDNDRFTLPQQGTLDPVITLGGELVERLAIAPPDQPEGGAWDSGVLITLLTRLACDPTTAQRASSDRFEIVVTADTSTHFAWRNNDLSTLAVAHARLDIIERAPAPENTP